MAQHFLDSHSYSEGFTDDLKARPGMGVSVFLAQVLAWFLDWKSANSLILKASKRLMKKTASSR